MLAQCLGSLIRNTRKGAASLKRHRAFLFSLHAPPSPSENAVRRLVGAILMEQTEEWAVQRARYVRPETRAPVCDNPLVSLPVAQTS